MKYLSSFILVFSFLGGVLSQPLMAAEDGMFVADLSPYLGTGTSDNGHLSYANGLSVSGDVRWEFLPGWTLGPRVEFLNSTFGADTQTGAKKALASYENRIFSGGLRLGFPLTERLRGYVVGMAGRGSSHLQVGESQNHSFAAFSVKNITGDYASLETGTEIRLHENLALQLGLLLNRYTAHFDDAEVNADGMSPGPAGGLTLSSTPSLVASDKPFANREQFTTYALKIGLAVHF